MYFAFRLDKIELKALSCPKRIPLNQIWPRQVSSWPTLLQKKELRNTTTLVTERSEAGTSIAKRLEK